jgi:sulfur-oxidizing protein SoxX
MLSVTAILGVLLAPMAVIADDAKMIEEGKQLSFNNKKGNCLACHMIMGGEMPGNIGPPLIAMKARFPDVAKLRAQIADSREMNPNTIMPPFGAHGILTDDEIDKVVAYIHTL